MQRIRRLLARERGFDGEVGTWLAALDDVRRQTKAAVAGLTPARLAWKPPRRGNSIGALLRHIAIVELDWILTDLGRGKPMPRSAPELARIDGALADPGRRPLREFLALLDYARGVTRRAVRRLRAGDLDSTREYKDARKHAIFSVRWILFHLVDHEAQHKGQILAVRRMMGLAGGE